MNPSIRNLSLALALVLSAGAANAQQHAHADAGMDAPAMAHDPSAPNPAPVHPELAGVFADFGGMAGMTALMDDFMEIMLADSRLRPFFENTDQVRIKRQLAEQMCAILGGGCQYSGRDMKTAHAGMGVDRANFNALVEDLQLAMNRKNIPFRSQNKLLAVLAPMHREAVTR